jgi:hypothetical protein
LLEYFSDEDDEIQPMKMQKFDADEADELN